MIFKTRVAAGNVRVAPAPYLQGTAQATCFLPEDSFPAVPGTSRMVELMELAALRLMKQHLRDGESSLCVEMNVTHAAPATPGSLVRAVASYECIAGRLHRFSINVFDESGLIGSAEHTRAVVAERGVVGRRATGKAATVLNA